MSLDHRIYFLQVGEGFVCLWCNERGKHFTSTEAVQKHMRDKGHTKMLHEGEVGYVMVRHVMVRPFCPPPPQPPPVGLDICSLTPCSLRQPISIPLCTLSGCRPSSLGTTEPFAADLLLTLTDPWVNYYSPVCG